MQVTLIEDLRDTSDNDVRVPRSMIEEVLGLLSEVAKIIEIGVVSEYSPSPVRDRCFLCLAKVRELRQALLAVLEE